MVSLPTRRLPHKQQCDQHQAEKQHLHKKRIDVPPGKVNLAGLDLAECDEKHQEYQQGLHYAHHTHHRYMGVVKSGDGDIEEIAGNARDDSEREGPLP